jgi:hypothetical protein
MKTRETDNGDKIIRGEKKRGKEGHIEKRIEHMLTHFLYVPFLFSLSLSLFFKELSHMLRSIVKLPRKYKLACVGKRINLVKCHHFHIIKSPFDASVTDNEIEA